MIDIRIQSGDFDSGGNLERLGGTGTASVASFTGHLLPEDGVTDIHIEHYPALARNELARIASEAQQRWTLDGVILVHRHGRLKPNDRVLFAAAACREPSSAIAACAFLVEALRERAPFWRADVLSDGSRRWR